MDVIYLSYELLSDIGYRLYVLSYSTNVAWRSLSETLFVKNGSQLNIYISCGVL